jgi:hypothetical protein
MLKDQGIITLTERSSRNVEPQEEDEEGVLILRDLLKVTYVYTVINTTFRDCITTETEWNTLKHKSSRTFLSHCFP